MYFSMPHNCCMTIACTGAMIIVSSSFDANRVTRGEHVAGPIKIAYQREA